MQVLCWAARLLVDPKTDGGHAIQRDVKITHITAVACLLIGCAAGAAANHAIATPPGAQVDGKRFQHKCIELKWDDVLGVQDLAPQMGAQGWELATFVSAERKGAFNTTTRIVACFKRQTG